MLFGNRLKRFRNVRFLFLEYQLQADDHKVGDPDEFYAIKKNNFTFQIYAGPIQNYFKNSAAAHSIYYSPFTIYSKL